jgi:hypothetical protein
MGRRSGKLITANESTVPAESLFDLIVMEDLESDGCLPNPPCADEGDGFKAFSESDYLLNQLAASETVPRRRGRRFTNGDAIKT